MIYPKYNKFWTGGLPLFYATEINHSTLK